ncbi:MAG: hypothetical protein ACE5GB_15780, partial [Acidimicrobiales bacterium]
MNRMAPGQTTEIARAAEGPALTDHVIASIVEKSDGIPLFAEEIAAAVVHHTGGEFTVPDSLENLLMSRLEALGELRDIAQAASIIGRELRLDELALLIDESGACELLELG